MNTCIRLIGNILALCFFFALSSCDDLFHSNREYLFLSELSKEWLTDTDTYEAFIVADSLSYAEYFFLDSEWETFNSSSSKSGFLGLKDREFRQIEVMHQVFLSQRGLRFSVEMEAGEPPEGPLLQVSLGGNQFSYDLFSKELLLLFTEMGRRPYTETINDKRVEQPFLSGVAERDTVNINGVDYLNVLEFELRDFKDQWEELTIVSFILAKEVGLLQFELHNGHVFNRVIE